MIFWIFWVSYDFLVFVVAVRSACPSASWPKSVRVIIRYKKPWFYKVVRCVGKVQEDRKFLLSVTFKECLPPDDRNSDNTDELPWWDLYGSMRSVLFAVIRIALTFATQEASKRTCTTMSSSTLGGCTCLFPNLSSKANHWVSSNLVGERCCSRGSPTRHKLRLWLSTVWHWHPNDRWG